MPAGGRPAGQAASGQHGALLLQLHGRSHRRVERFECGTVGDAAHRGHHGARWAGVPVRVRAHVQQRAGVARAGGAGAAGGRQPRPQRCAAGLVLPQGPAPLHAPSAARATLRPGPRAGAVQARRHSGSRLPTTAAVLPTPPAPSPPAIAAGFTAATAEEHNRDMQPDRCARADSASCRQPRACGGEQLRGGADSDGGGGRRRRALAQARGGCNSPAAPLEATAAVSEARSLLALRGGGVPPLTIVYLVNKR
jgi:hypothetical protein